MQHTIYYTYINKLFYLACEKCIATHKNLQCICFNVLLILFGEILLNENANFLQCSIHTNCQYKFTIFVVFLSMRICCHIINKNYILSFFNVGGQVEFIIHVFCVFAKPNNLLTLINLNLCLGIIKNNCLTLKCENICKYTH